MTLEIMVMACDKNKNGERAKSANGIPLHDSWTPTAKQI